MCSFIKFLVLPVSCIILLTACKNDGTPQQQIDKSLLTGRWEIKEALRNGKPTETLTGTFYEFSSEGTMRTNLTPSGAELECPFQLSRNEIEQKCEDSETEYAIEILTDSALVMSMEIKKLPFKISLAKVPPHETETVEEIIEQ